MVDNGNDGAEPRPRRRPNRPRTLSQLLALRERGTRTQRRPPRPDDQKLAKSLKLTYNTSELAGPFAFNIDPKNGILLASSGREYTSFHIVQFASSEPVTLPPSQLYSQENYTTGFEFRCFMWANNDAEVVTTNANGVVKVFDVQAQADSASLEAPLLMGMRAKPGTPAPSLLYVCSDRSVIAWDRRAQPDARRRSAIADCSDRVLDVEASADGHTIYTCGCDGLVQAWDERSNAGPLFSLEDNNSGSRCSVNSLQLGSRGTRLLAAYEKGQAVVIDLLSVPSNHSVVSISNSRTESLRIPFPHGRQNSGWFRGAYFSPCEGYIVGASDSGHGYLWGAATGQLLRTFQFAIEVPGAEGVLVTEPCTALPVHVAMAPTTGSALFAMSTEERFGIWQDVDRRDDEEGPSSASAPANDGGVDVIRDADEEEEEAEEEEEEEDNPEWNQNPLDLRPGECSFRRGYVEQTVHVCLTCTGGPPAGVCEQCAIFCHEEQGHEVVSLGQKGAFRCDCCTARFPESHRCRLVSDRNMSNERNSYGHNFDLSYCVCDGEDDNHMIQCATCWDWFHFRCLDIPPESDMDRDWEYVCQACAAGRYPFLAEYPPVGPLPIPALLTPHPFPMVGPPQAEGGPPALGLLFGGAARGRLLPARWREHLLPPHQEVWREDPPCTPGCGAHQLPVAGPSAAAPPAAAPALAAAAARLRQFLGDAVLAAVHAAQTEHMQTISTHHIEMGVRAARAATVPSAAPSLQAQDASSSSSAPPALPAAAGPPQGVPADQAAEGSDATLAIGEERSTHETGSSGGSRKRPRGDPEGRAGGGDKEGAASG